MGIRGVIRFLVVSLKTRVKQPILSWFNSDLICWLYSRQRGSNRVDWQPINGSVSLIHWWQRGEILPEWCSQTQQRIVGLLWGYEREAWGQGMAADLFPSTENQPNTTHIESQIVLLITSVRGVLEVARIFGEMPWWKLPFCLPYRYIIVMDRNLAVSSRGSWHWSLWHGMWPGDEVGLCRLPPLWPDKVQWDKQCFFIHKIINLALLPVM